MDANFYLQLVICPTFMVLTTNAKGKGYFQCNQQSQKAITCQEVDLPIVKAGFFNCSGYSFGDKCNLTCNDGYFPSSLVETICEENDDFQGNWSVGSFQCSECNGWNEWNDGEYKFIDGKVPWEVSSQLCENESGHLVTIESKEENDFIHKVVLHCADDKATWIGLNDRDTEGMWEWIAGTVFQYKNWNEGQPNGNRNQNCVHIDKISGEWHDRECGGSHPAMCEKEKPQ